MATQNEMETKPSSNSELESNSWSDTDISKIEKLLDDYYPKPRNELNVDGDGELFTQTMRHTRI